MAFFLVAAVTCGCGAFERGPKDYPYVAEQVRESGGRRYHRDLDGDARDEILKVNPIAESRSRSPEAVAIRTQGGQVVDQVNFAGDVIRDLQFCDFGRDGRTEAVVPVVRRDSLFLGVVNAEGRKQRTLFLTRGEPRREPEGTLPWDPDLRGVHLADLTGDGTRELAAVMMTQLARRPRGVWVLNSKSGERLGRWTSGAMIDEFMFEDIVGDGAPELLAATGASNNGARGGGMDDQHAYLFLLGLPPRPGVVWKREVGGLWARAYLETGDVDGNGTRDYVVFRRSNRQRPQPGHLERFDPKTGRTLRAQKIPDSANSVAVTNLDGEDGEEILVSHESGMIRTRGPDLQGLRTARRSQSAGELSIVPGLLRPGTPEVIVGGSSPYLLGSDLEPKALLPVRDASWTAMNRGQGRPAYLVGRTSEKTIYYRMADNPAYLLYRWGPWVLLLLGAGVAAGAVVWGRRAYRRHQALRRERIDLAEARDGGHLLARADGTVEHADEAARSLLGLSDPQPDTSLLAREVPDLRRLLEEIRDGSVGEETYAVEVPISGEASETKQVQARLKPLGDGRPQTWLIRLRTSDVADQGEGPSYRTWSLLARRVAHDLKNPLTSILLLVDRMREKAQASEEIGSYADRIESRVRSLRRMTTNFMKFVGDEEPSLVRADLQDFVEERVRELRKDLPADIELALETGAELPAAAFDRDQMHSVLENLVANAMEALPEGGTITVSLQMERGLQWHPAEKPRDYLALEVRDTGIGMGPETRARLFDPGYTTGEEGAGLGLVIAKKVAEDHGGHLEVESEEGIGTAVTVHLPVAGEPAQKEPAAEER
ncbi:MAG: PAS domain-containing sensor histidine kinase [Salinibacter sp.]|uniref:PAS domain-containing sensor histidine kinase n=1 Tax=Salinibacter sp. TaxID=2065818 RepID=UPI0035D4E0C2